MYLEPTPKFCNGALLRNVFCCCKIHKKTPVLESHFNNVTGLYPAISLRGNFKERTPIQALEFQRKDSCNFEESIQHRCFLVNFARYFRHLLYRAPSSDYFCSAEKIFYQQNKKEPSEKREKIETACKNNNHTDKTKT